MNNLLENIENEFNIFKDEWFKSEAYRLALNKDLRITFENGKGFIKFDLGAFSEACVNFEDEIHRRLALLVLREEITEDYQDEIIDKIF